MAKEYGKTIVIRDDTLIGTFPTSDYEKCTFVFKNCTFINFRFESTKNSIEFSQGNKFCETIYLDAPKVIIKENVNTENLERLSINGEYFKMPEGMHMRAIQDIKIASDIQSLKNNKIESMEGLMLQSSYGTTTYQNCRFIGKYGIKVLMLRGNLRIEDCELKVTHSNVKEAEEDHINGVYISCYGTGSSMRLINNEIKTDVLEITHPNNIGVLNTDVYKVGEYGRFLSRNQEQLGKVVSHSYIEPETSIDQFYEINEVEKNHKLKNLYLFDAFRRSGEFLE